MTTHTLKIWPEWYDDVINRRMEFQVREDDRDYQQGDTLRLCLYDPKAAKFMGPVAKARVGCVFRNVFGVKSGYVVMGIVFLNNETKPHHEAEDGGLQ